MKVKITKLFLVLLIVSISFSSTSCTAQPFRFTVVADTRHNAGESHDSLKYFKGVLEAIKTVGAGEFIISPGDMDHGVSINIWVKILFGTLFSATTKKRLKVTWHIFVSIIMPAINFLTL